MPETHTEDRRARAKLGDEVQADSRVLGPPGARTDQNASRGESFDVPDRHGVVSFDHDLGPELAQILNEVVGKRVVVVDHENHRSRSLAARYDPVNRPQRAGLHTLAPEKTSPVAG